MNEWLQKGDRVKSVNAIAEHISAYGYAGGENWNDGCGNYVGDIYVYVVLEFD